jgi:hypothetical protein
VVLLMMSRRGSRSRPPVHRRRRRGARTTAKRIPQQVLAAIKRCWPDGVVDEFASDESYFHDVHPRLERALRNIRGASLQWQTEAAEVASADWHEDDWTEAPPPDDEWQSYHVFFLAPDAREFHFEDETESLEAAEDFDEEEGSETKATYPGEGWIGCAVGISLAVRYAVINFSSYSCYEDGTRAEPDVESFIYSDGTHERIATDDYHRKVLGQKAFQRLERLGRTIASLLAKHRIRVLDRAVLDLRVQGLKPGSDVFLEEPLRVQDAFFFRGV